MSELKLRMVADYTPKGEKKGFKKGDVITVKDDASFNHFIRRGVAVDANDKEAKAAPFFKGGVDMTAKREAEEAAAAAEEAAAKERKGKKTDKE